MRLFTRPRPLRFSALLAPLLALALCAAIPAQTLEHVIALTDGDPGTHDNPFGVTLDPDSVHAYVPLCGELTPWPAPPGPWAPAWNNDQLLKIEIQTGAIVGQATVGHYPEDVALTLDATGATRHLYVSNSSSGDVTCLDASLTVIATIPLSPCFGGTYGAIFPFGIIASPDGRRVYVSGTACGTFDIIDSDPTSVTFNSVTSTFAVPNAFGRPAWLSPTELLVPVTAYAFNATLGYSDGSTTGFTVVDVTFPATQTTWMLTPFQQFDYPSITGLAATSNGTVLCGIGYGLTPIVVEANPTTGAVLRQLDLGIQTGVGLHGLALSPDESTLAVTAFNGAELAFIDIPTFTLSAVVATAGPTEVPQPNAVAFTADGSRVVVTLQGIDQLQVYGALPGFDLDLWTDPQVAVGTTGHLGVDHAEAGRLAWVYFSAQPGPTAIGPWTIQLGPVHTLLRTVVADLAGAASVAVPIPADPGLMGQAFHLQAVTLDAGGSVRFSNAAQTLIN